MQFKEQIEKLVEVTNTTLATWHAEPEESANLFEGFAITLRKLLAQPEGPNGCPVFFKITAMFSDSK
jgi:hypothetical protein